MKPIKTHYDNLQVSRTASAEVIAAAYRSLSLKYHPDRNGGDTRCAQIMMIVNASYAVLSDPVRRRAHDLWIAQQEADLRAAQNSHSQLEREPRPMPNPRANQTDQPNSALMGEHLRRFGLLYGFVGLIGIGALLPKEDPGKSNLPPYDASSGADLSPVPADGKEDLALDPLPADGVDAMNAVDALLGADATANNTQEQYGPPPRSVAKAPNGSTWPRAAAYVTGYDRLRTDGLSTVTVDNDQNDSDVFVKLVAIDADRTSPIRHFFIPAHSSFTVRNVRAGNYDVRYMDLSSGNLARSESFTLDQIEEGDGTRFSNITMTLYKVSNGNMRTYPLNPSEF